MLTFDPFPPAPDNLVIIGGNFVVDLWGEIYDDRGMEKPYKVCDTCGLVTFASYVDATIPGVGLWATLCLKCADEHHVKYGLGKGQRFDWSELKQGWVKIKG